MKNRIDILTQHYFPYHFIVLGVVFILMGVLVSISNPLVAFGFLFFGAIFISTHSRLVIDEKRLYFNEYLWILGYKKGAQIPFEEIKYIFINRLGTKSEYGFVARLSAREILYKGFIKLSNGESIFLGESTTEEKLLKKIKKIAIALDLEVKKNY
jgi:hypothetical protein